jgi:hypothetical protein
MKRIYLLLITLFIISNQLMAQSSPNGKTFGFGIIVGDPTGGTLKFWTTGTNAFVIDIGASYFGSPRIGVDYLWHFDAFNSNIAHLFAGPGGVIGIGDHSGFWYKGKGNRWFLREGNDVGLGMRGVFGVNVVPERTPLEIFFEIGVLVGLVPDFGSAIDAALGLRFYP